MLSNFVYDSNYKDLAFEIIIDLKKSNRTQSTNLQQIENISYFIFIYVHGI